MNEPKPELIIYDFDGVIVATAGLKHGAYLETLAFFNDQLVDGLDQALKTELVGCERRKVAEWVEVRSPSTKSDDFLIRFQNVLDRAKPSIQIVDGFLEFQYCATSGRIPQFIVSAAPADEIKEILHLKGISPGTFVRIFGQEDGTKSSAIRRLLEEQGITDPSRVWFFGDMPSDLAASSDSGVKFFRIDNPLAALSAWPHPAPSPVRFHQLLFS